MLNKELISSSLPILSINDTVFHAQQLMMDYHVLQLPIVYMDKYIGLISEEDVLNATDDNTLLKVYENQLSKLAVRANAHFIEAVQLCNDYGLSVVPVIDKELEWVGAISAIDLLKYLGR